MQNVQYNFRQLHGGGSTHPECAALFDPLFRFARKRVKNVSYPSFPLAEERVVKRSNARVSKYTGDINANARPAIR
jgi:hypothetical protein